MTPIRLFSLLLATALMSASAFVHADDNDFCKYQRPVINAKDLDHPKFKRSGDLVLKGGAKIAVYTFSMETPADPPDNYDTFVPGERKLDLRIKPELAAKLDAYTFQMGYFLVPKGWKPLMASEAADGGFYILFAPDMSGKSYASINNTGPCAGCAYTDASLYFKSAREEAQNDEFLYCKAPDDIRLVKLNANQIAYSVKEPHGNPVDGLATYYEEMSDNTVNFYDVQVSLPVAQHKLASVLLNQFVIPQKKKHK